jgi:hypothetical protein
MSTRADVARPSTPAISRSRDPSAPGYSPAWISRTRRLSESGPHVIVGLRNLGAAQQADEADEAPLERERGTVVGGHRGAAVIVGVPACSGASQLIRGVGWTTRGERK